MVKKMVYVDVGMKVDNYGLSVLINMTKEMVYIENGMKTDN